MKVKKIYPHRTNVRSVNDMRQYPENLVKETPCRNDGNLHQYVLYMDAEGDEHKWVWAFSESAYTEGEAVELEDGRKAHIDAVVF